MNEDLKSVVRAFQVMAETLQLLARRLDREFDALHTRVGKLEAAKEALPRQYQLEGEHPPGTVHEVQTSLTSLKGALYILLHEEPANSEARKTLLARAYRNVDRVMDLMKDRFTNLPG